MTGITALTTQKPSPPLSLPARFGRYRLTKLLAIGGMAQIYLAKAFGAEGFVKPLVIKRLDPRLADNPHFTNLFVNEAKLLVALNHGNIVPVFDFGRLGQELYMAMEYIAGPSLRKLLQELTQEGQTLDAQLAAYVAAEICKGLDYAHRKNDEHGRPAGIIHRDIKPTNVLLSIEGEVKIVDFGVAKLAGRAESEGMLAGTLAYMSPEQAERVAVDPRTDIFSTGLVLYELVSGRRAYDCDSALDVLALARRADLPPLPDHVPRELQEIICRATRRDPTERYSSAHEMEQALSEYLLLARSAGTVMDSISPASKLSALMKELPLEQPNLQDADDAEAEAEARAEQAVVGGPAAEEKSSAAPFELDKPPDLALMRDAAETFHSEFLTRVLMEEQQHAARRWPWLLAAGLGVLLVLGVVGVWWLRPPRRAPLRREAAATHNARQVVRRDAAAHQARPVAREDQGFAPLVVERSADGSSGGESASEAPLRPAGKAPAGLPYGYLNLNSIPWSQVRIDGRPMKGPTPLLHLRLRAGRHAIELENKERKLHKVIYVQIRAGATTWKVVQLR